MPLIKQLTFSQKSKPNPNQIKNEFIKMLDSSSSNNYFKQLFNRATNINLEFEREKLASFGEVKFGPSVNQFFSRTNEVETWKFRINKQYENILSRYSKIPIVPSGPNAELKYFNAKFKDKEVKIEIVDETIYVFNVNLKIFKKVDKPNKNNTFRTVCHIVGLRLSLIADGEDKIMDVPFVRAKKSCGVVGANNLIDDDYYFPMNLLIVIEKSASQFRSINPNYLRIATQGKTEQAILQINNAKKELLTRDLSMSNFSKISILIILFFLNFASFASEIKVTAKAKVNYNNEFSEDIKDEALILAKKAALKKATKKFKKDKLTLIKRLKDEFYESYDDFILDVSIQREKHNEKSKSFRVSIKATISKEAIEAFLNENNEIADGGADVNFGLVSIVSRTTSTKIYDDKKVKIRSNEGQKVNEERAASSGDSAIVSQSSKSMTVSKSGGSTEKSR